MTAIDDRPATADQPEDSRTARAAALLADLTAVTAHLAAQGVATTGGPVCETTPAGVITLGAREWTVTRRFYPHGDVPFFPDTWALFEAPKHDYRALSYETARPGVSLALLLIHAAHEALRTRPALAPALVWETRTGEDGNTWRRTRVATLTDAQGDIEVIAVADPNSGLGSVAAAAVGDGTTETERRLIVPVASTNATAAEILHQVVTEPHLDSLVCRW